MKVIKLSERAQPRQFRLQASGGSCSCSSSCCCLQSYWATLGVGWAGGILLSIGVGFVFYMYGK